MSDRIIINTKPSSVNLRLRNTFEEDSFEVMDSEVVLQQKMFELQLQQKYDEGFKQGYALAENEQKNVYQAKLNQKYAELNKIISEVDDKMKEYEKLFSQKVLDFSFFITEKVLRREIKNQSIIKTSINDSVKKVVGANSVIIKLNPQELEIINKENNHLLNNSSFSKIAFEADERIEIGGCIVETEIGSVDARISSQLNEIKKILEIELSETNG